MRENRKYIETNKIPEGYAWAKVIQYRKELKSIRANTTFICYYGEAEIYEDTYNRYFYLYDEKYMLD